MSIDPCMMYANNRNYPNYFLSEECRSVSPVNQKNPIVRAEFFNEVIQNSQNLLTNTNECESKPRNSGINRKRSRVLQTENATQKIVVTKVRQVRRVEANARERCRVHTISSAFETLRQHVPSYYNSYKLSKLGILRIACRYIESLNLLVSDDPDQSGGISPEFSYCVKQLAHTIAQESKMKSYLVE